MYSKKSNFLNPRNYRIHLLDICHIVVDKQLKNVGDDNIARFKYVFDFETIKIKRISMNVCEMEILMTYRYIILIFNIHI